MSQRRELAPEPDQAMRKAAHRVGVACCVFNVALDVVGRYG
jgi:hypothetical protein